MSTSGGDDVEAVRQRWLDARNVVWVFPDATTVDIGPSLHWIGSILAPNATVSVHNGVPVDGSLIANSIVGSITHEWRPPLDQPQLP